jgi:lipoprotein
MKNIWIVLCFALVSCKASWSDITGVYQKKGTDYFYSLELSNIDRSFTLRKEYLDVHSSCRGKWIQKGDTLYLRCFEEKDIGILLSSGYMKKRQYQIVKIYGTRLKLDGIILKKRKE